MDDSGRPLKPWQQLKRLRFSQSTLRRHARRIETSTLKHAHKFIVKRWDNIRDVRRHALAWLFFVGLLIGLATLQIFWQQESYSEMAADKGGTYAEGVVGKLDTMNPLFATTSAEKSASKLLFVGLLGYDRLNTLRGEAAESWKVSDDGKTYSIVLRNGIRWHDGEPLTVDDVIFTVGLMKDNRVKSPWYSSWAGVTAKKTAKNEVQFILPSQYAPFAHALTFGILPQHLLKDISPSQLRENSYNRRPIGSGPFKFVSLQVIDPNKDRLVVQFDANKDFYRGDPKLEKFQLHTYANNDALRRGFVSHEVNAAYGLTPTDVSSIRKDIPTVSDNDIKVENGVYALLKNDSPVFQDTAVRQAFVQGTDRLGLLALLGHNVVSLGGPILPEQVNMTLSEQAKYDLTAANQKLDAAGWKIEGNVRVKDGKKLEISLIAPRSGDYSLVINELARQWKLLGATVKAEAIDPDKIAPNYLQSRQYDALVFELALGADPDVYAYWHSSQAKPRGLNFANYKSGRVDDLLISARSRRETDLRDSKYKTFVDEWIKDAPAVALYRPLANYVTTDTTRSLVSRSTLADPIDRYRSIEYWTVEQTQVYTTP